MTIKQIKLTLLAVGFLIIGLGLHFQASLGVIAYVASIGVQPDVLSAGFLMSSFACGVIAVFHLDYNILWYTPLMIYTGATWMAFFDRLDEPVQFPIATAVLYTLLLLWVCADWLIERELSWSKIRSILSSR